MPIRTTFAMLAVPLVLMLSLAASAVADTFHVTNLNGSGAGSLRRAIEDANGANGPDEILFAPDLQGMIELYDYLPDIHGNVEIVGPGADQLVVDGNYIGEIFVFNTGNAWTITGLTVTRGGDGVNIEGAIVQFVGSLTVEGVRLVDNAGYAVLTYGAGTTIRRSEIAHNPVGVSSFVTGTQVVIEQSTFHSNSRAIYSEGDLSVYESTISGHDHESFAAVESQGPLTMYQTTIVGNSSLTGTGGLQVDPADVVSIAGTIIAGNVGGDCSEDLGVVGNHNLSGDSSCGFVGASDLQNVDPELLPLLLAGGPTPTLVPRPGSPAIDRSNTAFCIAVDQRGFARPVDGDGDEVATCDMGAVEYTPGIDELWQIFSDGFESGGLTGWSSAVP